MLAGLGNVYKSEALFARGISPFAPVAELSDEQLAALVEAGRRLLEANVALSSSGLVPDSGSRRTTGRDSPSERLWVYGRARMPCRKCGATIEVRKQGLDARLTYWCPNCQRW